MDVRTLIVILGISHFLQIIALSLQLAAGRSYRGIGWWLLWSGFGAAGFGFMLLREIPSFTSTAIVLQNTSLVLAVTFLYTGLIRFHDKTEHRGVACATFSLFFLSHSFLVLVINDVQTRSLLFALAIGIISLVSSLHLAAVMTPATRGAAIFLCLVLLMQGLFFAWRTVMILEGASSTNLYSSSLFNLAPFLDGFIVSNLLTFGVITMINQRAHAEMLEAKDHFELLFETSPDAVLITRASDGICRNVNEGFEGLTGYRREDILNRSADDLHLYVDLADRERVVTRLRERGSVSSVEIPFRIKNGRIFTGSMSARLIQLAGVPHIISVTRDISEKRRAEEALARSAQEIAELNTSLERRVTERTAELADANRELEGLVYSLAHDLRAPLRAMNGYSAILEEDHASRLDAEGLRLLARIKAGAQGMDKLIQDLIEYVRTGTAALHIEDVDMAALATETFTRIASDEVRQGFQFSVTNLPPARADASLMRIAFRELLSNSVKYSLPKPERRIEVTGRVEGGFATYTVSDQGIGFDPAYSEKIFGVFQRLHSGESFEGTGIGLAIVKRVIQRHGGKVHARACINAGTVITFTLPCGV